MPKRDLVLLCPGGAMQGVFGAGVLTAFEEANLYPRIRACFGASAGAINLAYHLARQTEFGSSIYLEDLTERKFIRSEYVPLGIFWRAVHKYVHPVPLERRVKPVDIDYLFDNVVRNTKPLDVDALNTTLNDIDFKILLGDPHSGKTEYIDARNQTVRKLKATTALIPYYNRAVDIDGKEYIDPTQMDAMNASSVLGQLNEGDKLIVIANYSFERSARHQVMASIEAWVASLMFDGDLPDLIRNRMCNLTKDLEQIRNYPDTIIVQPTDGHKIKPDTTDPDVLRRQYEHGMTEGKKLLAKLKHM